MLLYQFFTNLLDQCHHEKKIILVPFIEFQVLEGLLVDTQQDQSIRFFCSVQELSSYQISLKYSPCNSCWHTPEMWFGLVISSRTDMLGDWQRPVHFSHCHKNCSVILPQCIRHPKSITHTIPFNVKYGMLIVLCAFLSFWSGWSYCFFCGINNTKSQYIQYHLPTLTRFVYSKVRLKKLSLFNASLFLSKLLMDTVVCWENLIKNHVARCSRKVAQDLQD